MKTAQRVKERVDQHNRNRARGDRMIRRLVAGNRAVVEEVLGELREAFDLSAQHEALVREHPSLAHWIMLPGGELKRASLLEWWAVNCG